jgi:hypothetical protein
MAQPGAQAGLAQKRASPLASTLGVMNKSELLSVLRQEKFEENSYSFSGDNPDETLCLREEQGQWCVFYAERGLQTGKEYFTSEAVACDHFLNEMKSDPTTRSNWKSGFNMLKDTHE